MDTLDAQRRSDNMRRIRSKNSKPEVLLRSLLHKQGYRFRLHRKDLPGKPDIVFPGRRKVIFVHGCFWHQHPGCREGRMPGTKLDYWKPKLTRNQQRDAVAIEELYKQGWEAAVVWECDLGRSSEAVMSSLQVFLSPEPSHPA
jgi:DNA mismatch endonuclease (patch repair protein)